RNRPQAPDRAVTTHITGAGARGVLIRYATREYALMVTLALVIAGGGSGLALGTAVSALLTDEGPPGTRHQLRRPADPFRRFHVRPGPDPTRAEDALPASPPARQPAAPVGGGRSGPVPGTGA